MSTAVPGDGRAIASGASTAALEPAPLPTWPIWSSPQHASEPSVWMAQTCSLPASMDEALFTPGRVTAVPDGASCASASDVPRPRWPSSSMPQQRTLPPDWREHVPDVNATISAPGLTPGRSIGSDGSVLSPFASPTPASP